MTLSIRLDEVKARIKDSYHHDDIASRIRLHRLVFRWKANETYGDNLRSLLEAVESRTVEHRLKDRGVYNACPKCMGSGAYYYPDGGTWHARKGVVTRAFRHDTCDACWGSGDRDSPWTNLRELEARVVTSRDFLEARGVETPCPTCRGLGTRHYSSGATWRGGMGTASFAHDVCDTCWGSGDAHRHGVNLRALETSQVTWDDDQAVQYLSRKIGISLMDTKARLEELAQLCEKQARKRNIGTADPFWWQRGWENTAAVLRLLVKEKHSK